MPKKRTTPKRTVQSPRERYAISTEDAQRVFEWRYLGGGSLLSVVDLPIVEPLEATGPLYRIEPRRGRTEQVHVPAQPWLGDKVKLLPWADVAKRVKKPRDVCKRAVLTFKLRVRDESPEVAETVARILEIAAPLEPNDDP